MIGVGETDMNTRNKDKLLNSSVKHMKQIAFNFSAYTYLGHSLKQRNDGSAHKFAFVFIRLKFTSILSTSDRVGWPGR